MGTILPNSKQQFDELFRTASYNDIIKNYLRDYYTYGFKSYAQFGKGRSTVENWWKVFSSILGDEWECVDGVDGRNQIVLKTSPPEAANSMDGLYYLHNLSEYQNHSVFNDYLALLLALDPRSTLRGKSDVLPIDVPHRKEWDALAPAPLADARREAVREQLETVNVESGTKRLDAVDDVEYAIIDNWLRALDHTTIPSNDPVVSGVNSTADSNSYMPNKVRVNRQLRMWLRCPGKDDYKHTYDNLVKRTNVLYELGVIGDLRDRPRQRNVWKELQWLQNRDCMDDTYTHAFPDMPDDIRIERGDCYWYRSPLTLQYMSKRLAQVDPEFTEHFRELCSFYAQYYPLSEVGTILAERCGCCDHVTNKELFRFKHNYIQRPLYDYNLIDLMDAIEQQRICLIEYSHGTNLWSNKRLIVPLEIRVSTTNGREYILYYDMYYNEIRAGRLEFIDNITVYSTVTSYSRVTVNVRTVGHKKVRSEANTQDEYIDRTYLEQQLGIARQMLPHIWGTDTSNLKVDSDWEQRLVTISLPIVYDENKEAYIHRRLKKENRRFDTRQMRVFPTKELRNWIRSFYTRVNVSPDEASHVINDFDILTDVNGMWDVYFEPGSILKGRDVEVPQQPDRSEYTEYDIWVKGEKASTYNGHDGLFHELFSRQAIALADSVLNLSATDNVADLNTTIEAEIARNFPYYTKGEREFLRERLKDIIHDGSYSMGDKDSLHSRFCVPAGRYLYDFLPLTRVELRWLAAVLQDPLSVVFLSKETIDGLKTLLQEAPFDVKPLYMEAIHYHDQYNQESSLQGERHTRDEIERLRTVCNAMRKGVQIEFNYHTMAGERKHCWCKPAWIEYSRRDDVFRIQCAFYHRDHPMRFLLSHIDGPIAINENRHYDLAQERALVRKLHTNDIISIQIEFYHGEHNLPDRILTELSLWRKTCVYDEASQLYTMTLYYSPHADGKELLIRLLAYGPYIRIIADDNNELLRELKRRISHQRDLILDRSLEPADMTPERAAT